MTFGAMDSWFSDALSHLDLKHQRLMDIACLLHLYNTYVRYWMAFISISIVVETPIVSHSFKLSTHIMATILLFFILSITSRNHF